MQCPLQFFNFKAERLANVSRCVLIFLEKMEMVIEKIEVIGSHKNNLIDIFSVGQKIHDVVNTCGTNCGCYTYLSEIQFWTNLKKRF